MSLFHFFAVAFWRQCILPRLLCKYGFTVAGKKALLFVNKKQQKNFMNGGFKP